MILLLGFAAVVALVEAVKKGANTSPPVRGGDIPTRHSYYPPSPDYYTPDKNEIPISVPTTDPEKTPVRGATPYPIFVPYNPSTTTPQPNGIPGRSNGIPGRSNPDKTIINNYIPISVPQPTPSRKKHHKKPVVKETVEKIPVHRKHRVYEYTDEKKDYAHDKKDDYVHDKKDDYVHDKKDEFY